MASRTQRSTVLGITVADDVYARRGRLPDYDQSRLFVNSAERLPILDGLRAISILLVLASHMLPLGPKILRFNYTAGAMGMSLFFALSGFLITSTLIHNSNIFEFFVKRLARIIPLAYAYAFLVFTFVIFDPQAALWTASFLLNYFTGYMIGDLNNHFWSLCVEVHFYIAIALAVMIWEKKVYGLYGQHVLSLRHCV